MPGVDLADVARLLQDTAEQVVNPRFRALLSSQVHEKTPGDPVTDADREAEVLITAGLRRLDPGAAVVGEEAVAADPGLLGLLRSADRVWLVDPIDGTANFVAGSPEHAVMAARLEHGLTMAAVIWQPQLGHLWTAERGGGAYRDGQRLPPVAPPAAAQQAGAVAASYLPPDTIARIEANRSRFRELRPGRRCAGVAYPRLATGEDDFALFWKLMPWDHAPGELLVTETGGVVRRLDGTPYRADQDGYGLLAGHAETWEDVRRALLD